MPTAVVFIPSPDLVDASPACVLHCAARGYELAGIVVADWREVDRLLREGGVTVVVVARPEHVPPDGVPRVEVASAGQVRGAWPPAAGDAGGRDPRRRRPRLI
ncbi:hypothetical protein [Mangrovihabitans endophyticus]|uniref:Uncharacterized protein n=1 Tax=Mangrovihabitans endophyticus TaxID=1751298 RepID=A0A8J3C5E0_9ACTN|nr:hypothetical protein [Mangrovihabitans endophyticus]GGL10642.1 hypothetical protein GCM10012284_51750 [Mangrovihabitans endophyticus]